MAQTKRKRQTKHRGNAAGVVESRGRTSRPLPESQRKAQDKAAARSARRAKKPTWKNSWMKAGFACLFMFVFLMILNHPKHGSRITSAIFPALLALVLFGPANYYMEFYFWKKQNQPQQGGGGSIFGGFGRKK